MSSGLTTKQLVEQTCLAIHQNNNFLRSQSRDQLLSIQVAMEREAIRETNPERKTTLQLYADQAQQRTV